jgi:ferric-dicitrate binding protein FerR (iron transport regulator)
LIVPQGKRSLLTLSDGSKIWLNARTRVVYPTTFDETKREIFVDGEAFLEVFHNEKCPFIVKTKELQLEVLGTSFNIMAYEKDTVQSIVLVSGSVKINSKNKKETILTPSEMYSCTNGMSEVKTVNVTDYISWKSGVYQYKNEYLSVILQRLSRYFGQDISYSPEVARLKCSGKLDMKDSLSLVLNGISKTAPIVWQFDESKNQYRIRNK